MAELKDYLIGTAVVIILILLILTLNFRRWMMQYYDDNDRLKNKVEQYKKEAEKLFEENEAAGFYRGVKTYCLSKIECTEAIAGKYDKVIDRVGFFDKWNSLDKL